MNIVRWDEVEIEPLSEDVERQVVWGEKANLTRFSLAKGGHVLSHSHEAEQFTWVVEGALRLRIGTEVQVLRSGDMLVIPSHTEHEAWVLEPTVVLDFFAPRRDDWREGKDQYLTGSTANANTRNAVT